MLRSAREQSSNGIYQKSGGTSDIPEKLAMPRSAREQSSNGIYHAILRGINKQQIFECHEDYEYYIHILPRVCGLTSEKHGNVSSGYTNFELREKLSSKTEPEVESEEEQATPVRHCYIFCQGTGM